MKKREIAINDYENHKIHVFNSDRTHVISFGGKGAKLGEFNGPAGIAFHDDDMFVADQSNNGVQKLRRQGEYLSHFGEKGSLDHQLSGPSVWFIF